MTVNVGSTDRLVRIGLALVILGLALFSGLPIFQNPFWFWTSLVLAGVLVATAAVRFCPLYLPFGASTCQRPD